MKNIEECSGGGGSQENGPLAEKKLRQKRQEEKAEERVRRQKMESKDSNEIPDTRETSDIHGPLHGATAKKAEWEQSSDGVKFFSLKLSNTTENCIVTNDGPSYLSGLLSSTFLLDSFALPLTPVSIAF